MTKVQDILDRAKDSFKGQQMAPEKVEAERRKMVDKAGVNHQEEAAAFTEEIIRWFNSECNDRELTPEQRVFALALAFINFRESFPADKGGPAKFKEVAQAAASYYTENISV